MLITDLIEGLKIPLPHDIKHYTLCIKRQDDDLWVSGGPPPPSPPVNAWNKKEPIVIMVSLSPII